MRAHHQFPRWNILPLLNYSTLFPTTTTPATTQVAITAAAATQPFLPCTVSSHFIVAINFCFCFCFFASKSCRISGLFSYHLEPETLTVYSVFPCFIRQACRSFFHPHSSLLTSTISVHLCRIVNLISISIIEISVPTTIKNYRQRYH
ncbi:hypothetical protein GQ42DRAFT_59540 [Ramicandelaber brevisporus]|nr:hypothetical protein GQ42DRAFT_59540 [Ramicandelaber brevisporus]